MQITAELDNQHLEKLQLLETMLKKNTSELISLALDEFYIKNSQKTEGQKLLDVLQETGFLGSLSDNENLSDDYKQYLDWSHKI